MRVAYADPPYSGMALRYGRNEVNMPRLLAALQRFDGWALRCHVRGLLELAPHLPKGARVGAWCKTFVTFKKGVFPPYGWEPVIFKPARKRDLDDPLCGGVRDWVRTPPNTNGFFGAKPPEFCSWLFGVLGMEPDDEFHDWFKGSGAVTSAWKQWRACAKAGGPLLMEAMKEEA